LLSLPLATLLSKRSETRFSRSGVRLHILFLAAQAYLVVDDKLKEFKLDMRKGVRPYTELIPPPAFTHLNLPFNYT
jgi:hypothetical protein